MIGNGPGIVGELGMVTLVLMERDTELFESEPSSLMLSAESENVEEATEITPLAVLLVLGVKVAV